MSVKKVQILNATTGDTRNIVIPFELTFKPIDKWELIERVIDEEKDKSVNPIIDWELWDYSPIDIDGKLNKGTITYKIFWNIGGQLNNNVQDFFVKQFGTIGFNVARTKEKNFFKRSFFRLYYYDKKESFDQKLLFTEDLFLKDFEDISTLLYISNRNKGGYFLNWLKNDKITNGEIYMRPTFFNAKNGRTFDLIKYQGNIVDSDTLNQNYGDLNFVKIILNKEDLTYFIDGFNYDLEFQYNRED
jgi:hypothetical protein